MVFFYYRVKKDKETSAETNSSLSYDSQTTDGSTSHDSGLSLQEQVGDFVLYK